jgi:signal peptidase I
MEPTLNINDRVLVVKDKYINMNYAVGDVIVFYNPNYVYNKNTYQEFYDSLKVWNLNEQQLAIDTAFIKRVIGIEDDVVKITSDGKIYNNGELVNIDNVSGERTTQEGTYIVAKNTLFVLGDNIENSIDSRIYGSINRDQVVGKAVYKIYPFKEFDSIND